MSRYRYFLWPTLLLALLFVVLIVNKKPALAEVSAHVFAVDTYPIDTLVVKDGNVFYAARYCGGELLPPNIFLRSLPASGGPTRTLYEPSICDGYMVSNLAVDDQYVYWLDSQQSLQRVPRGVTASTPPTAVPMTPTINPNQEADLAVTASHYYWLERGTVSVAPRLGRVPKAGGTAQVVGLGVADYSPWSLKVDGSGNAYFLRNGTLSRAAPNASSFDLLTIGAAGRVQTYTLDATTIYWLERTSPLSMEYVLRSAPLANPTATNLLATLSLAGDPTLSDLVVDQANLYWVERRGTVFSFEITLVRMPLSGGSTTVMDGFTAFISDLSSDGRYLFFLQDGRVYSLQIDTAGIDLSSPLNGVEVIQSIQGPANDVPLVSGKDTYVRVYGTLNGAGAGFGLPISPAAQLEGTRNGVALPGSPLSPIREPYEFNTDAFDRRFEVNSVLFRLPPEWTNGTVTLQATLNPMHTVAETNFANNVVSSEVTFQGVPRPCLLMVPVQTTAGTLRGPDPSFQPFFDRAASVWPVDHLNVGFDGGPAHRRPRIPFGITGSDPYNLSSDFEMGYLLWNLWWTYNFGTGFICEGAGTTTVAAVPDAGRLGMAGPGVMFYLQSGGNPTSPSVPFGGLAGLAHELGHEWGRDHVGCPASGDGAPGGVDGNYPYPVCLIDFNAPLAHIGLDPISMDLVVPMAASDYMSYGSSLWTSDYTYKALLNALQGNVLRSQALNSSAETLAAADQILISGLMNDDTPLIGYAVQVSGDVLARIQAQISSSTVPSADYKLRVLDAGGNLLHEAPLQIDHLEGEGGEPVLIFSNLVAATPAPARYEVRNTAGDLILQRTAGPNPPQVSITSPAAGVTVGASFEVAWNASDPDGDALMSTVRYSPDNGATWQVLGGLTAERSLLVDVSTALPGGSQALIQVIVSDGVHSATATSAPFVVPQRAPMVAILDQAGHPLSLSQPGGAQQSEGQVLHAYSYDAEDGQLSGEALQWQVSGPETRSGSGDTLWLDDLAPGAYQVTLAGTDSANTSNQAQAAFNISPKRIFDEPNAPQLDGVCDDPAYATDTDPIRLRYGDGSLASVRLVHSGDWVYACFSGLELGSFADSFVALRFDPDSSGGSQIGVGDLIFMLRKNGSFFTGIGTGASDFVMDDLPQGLVGSVSQTDQSWSAEMRIDQGRLGGWNKLVRMRATHYWRNGVGDDTPWPKASAYDVPSSWGQTALGALTQSITFPALADRSVGDPEFALSASASSGLPVSYTADGACNLMGNWVYLAGPGQCTITAAQPGNAAFAAATPVERTFTISAASAAWQNIFLPLVVRR